jgi:hypothetical protein
LGALPRLRKTTEPFYESIALESARAAHVQHILIDRSKAMPDMPNGDMPTQANATTDRPSESGTAVNGAVHANGNAPRGRPFPPGVSGNPSGRPKGSRNKLTVAAEEIIGADWSTIIQKLVEKAKNGDASAIRLCLDRLMPVRKERAIEFDLPPITSAADAAAASASVLEACANGTITPDEGSKMMALIASHIKTLEFAEFESKLAELEEAVQNERLGG